MKTKSPDSNDLTLEVSVRIQISNYKAKLGLKRTWVIALVVALIRLGIKLWLDHH